MKKVGMGIVIILIMFLVYKAISPDVWNGTSDNGKWEAKLFETKEGSKWVYDGNFYWKGTKQDLKNISVTMTQYIINGKMEAGNKADTQGIEMENDTAGFVGMTSKPSNSDKVQAVIHWNEDGKNHSDIVTLSKSIWH